MKLNQLEGKNMGIQAEIITIFKVNGKYYPATEYNCQLFETYMHTGQADLLNKLEHEIAP